jgi:Mannosyl-glycoprotein endo-beta-N-acetylglucosaminidase
MKSASWAFALLLLSGASEATSLPRILASADNQVPLCVTPAALMDFVAARNASHQPPRAIDPRFTHVADLYERFGQCVARPPAKCVAVRWDYAFFQMLIETNYLTFRRPDGVPAAVTPQDNNFAGVGATVPGWPGERFKDVPTGVLAHLQHVLMYSTARVPDPVAKRTRQVQDDVQAIMRRLERPVTFADLAREWTGTNKNSYGAELQKIAEKYEAKFCHGPLHAAQASLR